VDPNPNILAGSESESEKSSDLDSDPDTVVKNFLWKIADQKLEREKTVSFFSWKTYFSVVHIPQHQWEALF
jgi:hypothetical protein